jgi:hypothetical protein
VNSANYIRTRYRGLGVIMPIETQYVHVHKELGIMGVTSDGIYIDVGRTDRLLFLPWNWECLGEL